MHRARGPFLFIPGVIMESADDPHDGPIKAVAKLSSTENQGTSFEASSNSEKEVAVSDSPEMQNQETVMKFGSIPVTVPEPSRNKVKNGKIYPFGMGRSRSSSTRGSTNSLKSLFIKDVWAKAELYLTDTMLCYRIEGTGVCEFKLEDVLGIQVSQTPPIYNDNACELSLHLYLVVNPWTPSRLRMQCSALIVFDSAEDFKSNLSSAKEWKRKVLIQTQKAVKSTFVDAAESEGDSQRCNSTTSELSEEHSVLLPRRFLVFINPMAGAQNGRSLFEKYVKKMFDLAEIQYVVEYTECQNHAKKRIMTYKLSDIDGIVISSGDGLVHEVVNGIMARQDWETAIKTPIGVLPTGSGNALCASALYESGEDYGLEMATFQIIRGGVAPMDLATVQLSDGSSLYMTIMASWGMIADVDIESEKFRKLGKVRFTLGALSSIAKKKVYRGKLSYLAEEGDDKEPESVPYEAPIREDDSSSTNSEKSASESPSLGRSGTATTTNGHSEKNDCTDSTPSSNPAPTTVPPPTDLLVPLDQPLPPAWTTKEDNFLAINPSMISHLSSENFIDRNFSMGTGKFRLLWMDGNTTRSDALNIMTSSSSGDHINSPMVFTKDVRAFRLEPLSPPGMVTVDGEQMPYGPMQAQVHPRLARLMSRKRK